MRRKNVRRVRIGAGCKRERLTAPTRLGRKILKKRRRHLHGKFLEHANRSRHVPVAEMNERKIEGAKAPLWHDLDQAAVAHEFRLNHRRQVADPAAGKQRGRQTGEVIHRERRLECQRLRADGPIYSIFEVL
jgi:hypothetical protein